MGGGHSRNRQHERSINLEDAKPGGGESELFQRVDEVLERARPTLKKIEDYKGCQELARMAMSDPSAENELMAFEGLLDSVDSIATFFEYSQELERLGHDLLLQLASEAYSSGREVDQPALFMQLARIFEFSLVFDEIRMRRPNLSNDFSYYRRLLPKFSAHQDVRVKDDAASGMALFTAEHIPMTKCLVKGAVRAFEQDTNAGAALSILANSALAMLRSGRFSDDLKLRCARGMTGSLVVYDHIAPAGAFTKRSPIKAHAVITMLQRELPKEIALTNAIRFSTVHFKDAPGKVQNLFD